MLTNVTYFDNVNRLITKPSHGSQLLKHVYSCRSHEYRFLKHVKSCLHMHYRDLKHDLSYA